MQFGSNTFAQWTSLLSQASPSRKSAPPRPPPPLTWADRVARGLTPVRYPCQLPQPISPPPPLHPPSPPSLPTSLHLSFDNPLSPPATLLPPSANAHQSPRLPSSTLTHSANASYDSISHPITPSTTKFPTGNDYAPHPPPSQNEITPPLRQQPNLLEAKPATSSEQTTSHPAKPVSPSATKPNPVKPPSPTKPNPVKPPSPHTSDPQISQPQLPRPQISQQQFTRPQATRSHVANSPNGYVQAAKQRLSPMPNVARPPLPQTQTARSQIPRSHPAQMQTPRPVAALSQMTWSQHAQSQEVKGQATRPQNAGLIERREQEAGRIPSIPKPPSTESVRISSTPPTPSSPKRDVAPTKRRRRPPRASPESTMSLSPRALRGLVNCGNSCFTNVVLQALMACEPFRRLILQCEKAEIGKADGLVHKFARLVREMTVRAKGAHEHGGANGVVKNGYGSKAESVDANGWSYTGNGNKNGHQGAKGGNSKAVVSDGEKKRENGLTVEEPLLADWFYDVFPGSGPRGVGGANGGSQEDAEEFLSFVLNGLHEELVALGKEADSNCDWDNTGNGSDSTENGSLFGQTDDRREEKIKSRNSMKANGVWNCWGDGNEGGVWEEMTRKGKTVEVRGGSFAESGITDIFGGVLRSEVKRGRAKPSVTKEPFFRLSLDIESGMIRDVEHALAAYFEPERVEGYEEGDEEEIVEMRKQVSLEQAPQVLILHLKRFSHNSMTGALTKVSRMMPFPGVLELPAQAGYGAGGKCYVLTAVATHIGKELAGGHYTCDVWWEGESWVSCDDSKVTRTSLAKVVRKQAYLLFYSLRTRMKKNGEEV